MKHYVIVNFNQTLYLKNYIKSILRIQSDIGFIVVVNNGDEIFESNDDKIFSVVSENNGYLKGLEFGYKYISDKIQLYDPIVFSNPDLIQQTIINDLCTSCVYAPSVFDNDIDQNPNVLSEISRVKKITYKIQFSSYYLFVLFNLLKILKDKYFAEKLKDNKNILNGSNIYMFHGSVFILNKNIIETSNCFDFNLFLWGEEAVISYALRNKNIPIIYNTDIIFKHLKNSSTSKIDNRNKYNIWKKSFGIYSKYL